MHILLTFEYPLHKVGYGGGHQIFLNLAANLSAIGHQVSLVNSGFDQVNAKLRIPSCRFYSTKISINRFLFNSFFVGLYSFLLIAVNRPRAVIGFGGESYMASIACKLFRIKFYPFFASPYLPSFDSYISRRINFNIYLQYLSIRNSAAVFMLSNYLLNQAIEKWNIKEDKLFKIGAGLDKEYLKTNLDVARNISEKYSFNILTIGRIDFRHKPLNSLCHAISRLNGRINSWTVVGSGPDLKDLINLSKNINVAKKTKFLGTLNSAEIIFQLNCCDIVILPSNYESLMLTAYESISQNKVTIVNNVADLKKDFSACESVIFMEASDEDSMVFKLNYAMDNYLQLASKASMATELVRKNLSWTISANRIIEKILL